jgi:hypothetical protein
MVLTIAMRAASEYPYAWGKVFENFMTSTASKHKSKKQRMSKVMLALTYSANFAPPFADA